MGSGGNNIVGITGEVVSGIDSLGIVIVVSTKSDFLLLGAKPTALTRNVNCEFGARLSISKVVDVVLAVVKVSSPTAYSTSKLIDGPFVPLDQLKTALLLDIIN
jgi:hypothetical protein